MKNRGIICYATAEDRLRLAAVANTHQTSGSAWILEQIRARYTELYGDLDPALAAPTESDQ